MNIVRAVALSFAISSAMAVPRSAALAMSEDISAVTPIKSAGMPWYLSDSTGGIRVNRAWKIPGSDGEGVVVAVLDSGVTRHPDLATLVSGYTFYASDSDFYNTDEAKALEGRIADDDEKGNSAAEAEARKALAVFEMQRRIPGGWDTGTWCPDQNDPANLQLATGSDWHGTAMAGLIAGKENAAQGISGIARKATVLPLRVTGECGQTSASAIADAIRWAAGGAVKGIPANKYPAQVISLSVTVGKEDAQGEFDCAPDSAIGQAVRWAIQRGSSVVVAAGNDHSDTDSGDRDDSEFSAPANCPGVISVAATDFDGKRALYSVFGGGVTLGAPGGDLSHRIRLLSNSGRFGPEQPAYQDDIGTSIAAPIVSGTVAMMVGVRRKAGMPALTPEQIKAVLVQTARPSTTDAEKGKPADPALLDADAAVRAALES